MTGPERVYVDRGYRGRGQGLGHDVRAHARIEPADEARTQTKVGHRGHHMKTDGRLDRNVLKGQTGDTMNALLAAITCV